MQPAASCGVVSVAFSSMHSLHTRACHRAPLIRPADGAYGRRPMRPLQSASYVRSQAYRRHRASCASSSSHGSSAQSSDEPRTAQQCQQDSSDSESFGPATHFPAEPSPSSSNHWLPRSLRLAGMVAVSVIAGGSIARAANADSRCPPLLAVLGLHSLSWLLSAFSALVGSFGNGIPVVETGAARSGACLFAPLTTQKRCNRRRVSCSIVISVIA